MTGYRKGSPGAILSKHIKDWHRRAARVLGYALAADAPDRWWQTASLWRHHLTTAELASVAFMALRGLEPDDRAAVVDAAMYGGAE